MPPKVAGEGSAAKPDGSVREAASSSRNAAVLSRGYGGWP